MKKSLKLTTLAAAVALAMGSGAVFAAAPAATQLPGQGAVDPNSPTATVGVGTITAGSQTITLSGNTVIDWGKATGATAINPNQPAGFNVGSAASLAFGGTGAVLNVDVSGNASQIFGSLSSTAGNLFVANTNGIIVGAGASITASGFEVGLIGNSLVNTNGTAPYGGASFTGVAPNYAGGGGDVTVQPGGGITASTILISGGGAVNVDLGTLAGAVSLQAGVPNSSNALVKPNAGASLTVGTAGGGLPAASSLGQFASAGDATNNGTLPAVTFSAGGANDVAGTFTNNGEIGSAATSSTFGAISGMLVNNGQMNVTGAMGAGGIDNDGSIAADSTVSSAGDFGNAGELTATAGVAVTGGNFTNTGSVTAGYVNATNGSIGNRGILQSAVITTWSDASLPSFVAGASYSIINSGTITSPTSLYVDANDQLNQTNAAGVPGSLNGSGGGFFTTGALQVAPGGMASIGIFANNNIELGGVIQTNDGAGHVQALSVTSPLSSVTLQAANYSGAGRFTSGGSVTVTADLTTSVGAFIAGNKVNLMANLTSGSATAPVGTVTVVAGGAQDNGYAVRVAAGKTVTANAIYVEGDQAGDNPNVILQGTLAGHAIEFGDTVPVSDVFSGPNGGIVAMDGTGPYTGPYVDFDFTGRIKSAPYLNDANFRYNDLPITNASATGKQLYLTLTPAAYTTNGTGNVPAGGDPSAVNVLVHGDVLLAAPYYFNHPPIPAVINGSSSAVTGVTNLPNTHLVLQSTGNIQVGGTWSGNDFYWPGYVYLGNINTDAAGNALPGTLGLGNITLAGNFSNVLPGDVAGASGIHFITQLPLVVATGALITTNANAWFNFGTDVLTQAYSTGTLLPNTFFGGAQGPGTVVNYAAMPAANFVTQPPVSDK